MNDTIYFVTGSEGKAREVAKIMPNVVRIKLDLPEIQSLDVREVLESKLMAAHQAEPDKTLVVEDTTFTIPALGRLPGTLIKWFEQELGADGVYRLTKDYSDHSAVAAANLGVVFSNGKMLFATGEVHGRVVESAGSNGFGFDKIFIADGQTKRYSEMTDEQKNAISHRKIAWERLKLELSQL